MFWNKEANRTLLLSPYDNTISYIHWDLPCLGTHRPRGTCPLSLSGTPITAASAIYGLSIIAWNRTHKYDIVKGLNIGRGLMWSWKMQIIWVLKMYNLVHEYFLFKLWKIFCLTYLWFILLNSIRHALWFLVGFGMYEFKLAFSDKKTHPYLFQCSSRKPVPRHVDNIITPGHDGHIAIFVPVASIHCHIVTLTRRTKLM